MKYIWVLFAIFGLSVSFVSAQDTSIALEPFAEETLGIQGLIPTDWEMIVPGRYDDISDDLTFIWFKQFNDFRTLSSSLPSQLGLSELPDTEETLETDFATWNIFSLEEPNFDLQIIVAIGEHDDMAYAVILQTPTSEFDSFRSNVFVPVMESIVPFGTIALEPFAEETLGIQGVVPMDWEMMMEGRYVADDLTFIWFKQFNDFRTLSSSLPSQLGLSELPDTEEILETDFASWNIFSLEEPSFDLQIIVATGEHDDMAYAVILQAPTSEFDSLRSNVFVPVMESIVPFGTIALEPFAEETLGIQGLIPADWEMIVPGRYDDISDDLTFIWFKQFNDFRTLSSSLPSQLGLSELPDTEETLETDFATWNIFSLEEPSFDLQIIVATGEHDDMAYAVILQAPTSEFDSLRSNVFVPVMENIVPFEADE